jgi:large subunit ribosomal protein L6e
MAPKTARTGARNPDLVPGIKKFSRSKMYHRRGLWAIKAKNGGQFPKHDAKPVAQPDPSAAPEKAPKFYPADDVKTTRSKPKKQNPTKLRFGFDFVFSSFNGCCLIVR